MWITTMQYMITQLQIQAIVEELHYIELLSY